MKKLFFMLIATICVAGAYAQNMQIWTGDDIMYEQSVATIDSTTFTQSSAPEQEGTLYKTWEGIKTDDGYSQGVRITLSQNNTFSYSFGQDGGDGFSWVSMGSGTFLQQGKLGKSILQNRPGILFPLGNILFSLPMPLKLLHKFLVFFVPVRQHPLQNQKIMLNQCGYIVMGKGLLIIPDGNNNLMLIIPIGYPQLYIPHITVLLGNQLPLRTAFHLGILVSFHKEIIKIEKMVKSIVSVANYFKNIFPAH